MNKTSLTEIDVTTPTNMKNHGVFIIILKNEKYKSEALLHTYYTTDFLTKNRSPRSNYIFNSVLSCKQKY